ncbi:GH14655 [Drosophila grimshawi]|uniref:GH14655 n=2 Tax=Drosophila grimshawi TaxID=7222 RepID=B4IXQ8_DROGR|nr:GH14655 [Drosophila grimshawi]
MQLYDAHVKKVIWDSGLDMFSKLYDLKGREIVFGVFNYKPYMLLDYLKKPAAFDRFLNKSEAAVDGTEVRVLRTFCELYNCTVQIDTSENSDWGDVFANVTGVGLMGMLLNRTVEYGIGGFFMLYGGYQNMEMTTFLGRSGITCLVPAPQRMINWILPLRPFQGTLWLCIIFCLVIECISLAVTRFKERLSDGIGAPQHNSWQQSLYFGVVSTLKLFVNQSTSYVATSYALRTILLASYILDIILTTVYGGGLAAILTLPKLEEVADSRQRLYEHKLIWTGTSIAWVLALDMDNTDPVLQGLLEHYQINDGAAIAKKSRSEQMGFVLERLQFGHLANADLIPDDALHRLKLMVDDIYYSYSAAYVPRLWPYLKVHNDFILMWHSSGLDKYWEWKISGEYMSPHRHNRIASSQRPNLYIGPVPLGIDNFIGLIMLWCFGMGCSLLAFVGELWYFSMK